ncbi:hypothetical protein ACFQGT_01840 [Natrialbaceae archaeon GCM10025810]|uniref:hypothetical protein n=1 Tax=Halovalidus salilacus TaxID=3075124 RepID=UPI00361B1438
MNRAAESESELESGPDLDRLQYRLDAAREAVLEAVERNAANDELSAVAAELRDVVDAADDLLGTVDLERLPSAVDAGELPTLVDVDGIPDAVRDRNPDAALNLGSLRRAVFLRELWNTVDLVEFRRAAGRLEGELEDVFGPDSIASSSDGSQAAADVKAFLAEVKPDATNAAMQQRVSKEQRRAREGVVRAHAEFETLYAAHQRGPGYVGRKPVSRNPTAVSTAPAGPLPASASTRISTVPTNVRRAKVDALPRIYGRRWRRVDGSS